LRVTVAQVPALLRVPLMRLLEVLVLHLVRL
jgi:hypothetical protein